MPPPLVVPNVTAHLSSASVLLYIGPLLCGFNVANKGLMGIYGRGESTRYRHTCDT